MGEFCKIPLHVPWFIRLGRECGKSENFAHVPCVIMRMLDMGNCVDGTFCMDDENVLLGSFSKGKFKINK